MLWLTAAGTAALAGVSWWLGGELLAPTNHPVPTHEDFPARTVSIPGDGRAIAGWWLDFGGDSPVVLLAHGIRADRSSMIPHARALIDAGFSVLLIDLQAHGETPGEHITLGWRESADVRAARDWIRAKAPGRRVGVIGTSLGGAAVLLGPQPSGFDAVVLESVYPRLWRAIENRLRMRVGALAPVLTPLLLAQVRPRLHVGAGELEPIRNIDRLGAPVLVVGGSRDLQTTHDETIDLYDAASSPKNLWIVEGAAHQDLALFDSFGYEQNVIGFLRQHLGVTHDPATQDRIAAWEEKVSPTRPAGPREPSTTVIFFATGLDRPLADALQLVRLQKLCVTQFSRECARTDAPELMQLPFLEDFFDLGPLFAPGLARVRPPVITDFKDFVREYPRARDALLRDMEVYVRLLATRLAAVNRACPTERSDQRRRFLNSVLGANYQYIVKLPQDEYSKLTDTLNNDADHMAPKLREEWLETTCGSADDLAGSLLVVFADKVRPYTGGANGQHRVGRVGSELGHLMSTAMILAREVDPTVDARMAALVKRAQSGGLPFTMPAAAPLN
jgi:alpha-beta hydrolase superfamily lysophospholipase